MTDKQPGEGAASASALHAIRPDWLSKHVESILDPALPIIDAHLHLWDMPGNRYLQEDFHADAASGHNVAAAVYVQSGVVSRSDGPEELRGVGETEFAAKLAAEHKGAGPKIGAILAPIDYVQGKDFERTLAAHEEAANGLLRGFRGITHWHKDPEIHKIHTAPNMLEAPASLDAIGVVNRQGLSLDVWAFHTQLSEVLNIARTYPDLTLVVDHFGTPLGCGAYESDPHGVFADWSKKMAEIAQYPRVFMKIGGIGMRFSGLKFNYRAAPPSSEDIAAALKPYYEFCIEKFGYGRCLFESNFPVDKTSYSYAVLWNAYKRLAKDASPADRARLFAGNAAAVYRMSLTG